MESATDLKIIQPVMGRKHRASVIAHRNRALGECPPRPFHAWGLK